MRGLSSAFGASAFGASAFGDSSFGAADFFGLLSFPESLAESLPWASPGLPPDCWSCGFVSLLPSCCWLPSWPSCLLPRRRRRPPRRPRRVLRERPSFCSPSLLSGWFSGPLLSLPLSSALVGFSSLPGFFASSLPLPRLSGPRPSLPPLLRPRPPRRPRRLDPLPESLLESLPEPWSERLDLPLLRVGFFLFLPSSSPVPKSARQIRTNRPGPFGPFSSATGGVGAGWRGARVFTAGSSATLCSFVSERYFGRPVSSASSSIFARL